MNALLRNLFLKDLGLKGVSLLLAFLLWNQVMSQQTVQRTVSAPIVFRGMPEGLEISNDHPTRADVTLRSDRGNVSAEAATIVVDLASAVVGMNVLNLTAEDVRRPSGVDVLGITPARIHLQLENSSSKRVKIEPTLVGEPASGYRVSGVRTIPPDILISGPESHVHEVSAVPTGPIEVTGKSETFSQVVFVDLEDLRLRIRGTPSVNVVVTIEEKRRQVTVGKVVVKVEPEGIRSRLYTKTVTLEGTVPVSYSGKLNSQLFQAVVDLSDQQPQREPYQVVPLILIPEEYDGIFRLERTRPEEVKVRRIS